VAESEAAQVLGEFRTAGETAVTLGRVTTAAAEPLVTFSGALKL
jgi:phosphoribosylformylglycinamidine cyclo-ligase